ncbi:GD12811 [Drosophila simulans]|uniref:GD12811 n=1 Tax=Drosophila simulans TaxID=7240 RepID=B4QQ47_DROSI|nr:GD12811 [Drosophila simulans]
MLERRTSTPSPINYYRPTDLTYNHRKRKAMGVEHVVGALTLTPIKVVGGAQQHQQILNEGSSRFRRCSSTFLYKHGLSLSHCNGQPQQQQHQHQPHQQQQQQALQLQQQQQHSSNMAQKRDRDRDLSTSNGNGNSSNTNNNNNNNNNTSLDPTATSSNCSSSSSNNSAATPPKPLIGGGGLSANHVDEYGVFGEYVAITIRKLKTSKSKIVVKHLINNLLYEAELGKYDHGMPASKEPPQLYNMQ